jgi:hypothetical protein
MLTLDPDSRGSERIMTQVAHRLARLEPVLAGVEAAEPETLTLLDLVAAVADAAESDEEVVATIQYLVETGRVHLIGNFCDGDVARHEDD